MFDKLQPIAFTTLAAICLQLSLLYVLTYYLRTYACSWATRTWMTEEARNQDKDCANQDKHYNRISTSRLASRICFSDLFVVPHRTIWSAFSAYASHGQGQQKSLLEVSVTRRHQQQYNEWRHSDVRNTKSSFPTPEIKVSVHGDWISAPSFLFQRQIYTH